MIKIIKEDTGPDNFFALYHLLNVIETDVVPLLIERNSTYGANIKK